MSPDRAVAVALAFLCGAMAAAGIALLVLERPRRRRAAPGWLRALATAGARLRPRARAPADLAGRIAAAGRPGGLGPRELTAAKLSAAALGGVAGAVLGSAAPGRLGSLVALTCPVAGFLGPDMWLARRAGDRARRVRRELPSMLDLLRVTVEAGSSLPEALRGVGERASGPLAAECRAVGREVVLGIPLRESLRAMTVRLPQPEVATLVAALERATRHGTPLAEALAAQSHEARLALQRRVREEAARAGPKIQLVVALMLVPSVLLLVAAALAAALLESGVGGITGV